MEHVGIFGQLQALAGLARRFPATKFQQARRWIRLETIPALDPEKFEKMLIALVRGNERAASLMANQNMFADQFIDRLAQRTNRHTEFFGQLILWRDGLAANPLATCERRQQRLLDCKIKGRTR